MDSAEEARRNADDWKEGFPGGSQQPQSSDLEHGSMVIRACLFQTEDAGARLTVEQGYSLRAVLENPGQVETVIIVPLETRF